MKRAVFVLLLLAACAPGRLKAPSDVSSAQALTVQGYPSERLAIADFRIGWFERDGEGVSTPNARRVQHGKQETYRFDLHGKGRSLRGECTEEARKSLAGSIAPDVRLACRCREGSTNRLSLELINGRGKAQVAGAPYTLFALHESEQGRKVAAALGYAFRSKTGTGVVDVTEPGRAWLPTNLSDDEQLGLICGYASLLLRRPVTFD